MRKLAAVGLSAPLALAVAAPAQAQDIEFTFNACGTTIGFETLKDTTRFLERGFGFQVVGNAVVRLYDLNGGEDSFVDIRIPGRAAFTVDPETNIQTIVLTGSTLLFPDQPGQAEAFEAAGLPEVSLIKGRVVITEQLGPEGPIEGTQQVVSYTPNVTDLCAELAG
jgi:hypothetical protein